MWESALQLPVRVFPQQTSTVGRDEWAQCRLPWEDWRSGPQTSLPMPKKRATQNGESESEPDQLVTWLVGAQAGRRLDNSGLQRKKKKKHALHCPARPMTVLCPRVNVAPSRRHSTHTHTRTHRHTKLQKPPDGYGNPVDRKDRAELGAGPRARVTSIPSIIHPIHPSIR